MNCSSMLCKKPIDDDSIFCKYCGAKQPAKARATTSRSATDLATGAAQSATRAEKATGKASTSVNPTESGTHASALDIPEPPRFTEIPVQEPVVYPANPTPATDFFVLSGTLKIYKGNSDVVVVPEGVTSIGTGVFRDHQNLREVYLPEGVLSISSEAFAGCTSLVKINIPEGVISIGPKAFMNCTSLEHVFIPRTVNKILDKAFQDCSALREIYMFDAVTTLSYFAFQNCTSLEKVRMPAMLLLMCEGLFQGCSSLKGIELNDRLKNIERHAFFQSGLEYIVIPESCINIEEHAFGEIPSLRGITVPKITKIDNYTFVGTNLINKGTIRYVM